METFEFYCILGAPNPVLLFLAFSWQNTGETTEKARMFLPSRQEKHLKKQGSPSKTHSKRTNWAAHPREFNVNLFLEINSQLTDN